MAILNFSKITCTLFLTSIFEFLRSQKIVSSCMAAILNFRKTSHVSPSPYRGECDCKIWIIFSAFATSKKLKMICGGHFEFQQNLKKITCTSPYCGECDCKIYIISDVFKVFVLTKKFGVDLWRLFWILVASLKNHLHIHMLLRMWFEN